MVLNRLDELETRYSRLEITLKYNDALAARITGNKTIKRKRAKREWSEEEKAAFHAKMVAAKKAKEKERPQASKFEDKLKLNLTSWE